MGGSTVQAPQPTYQEMNLQQQQANALKQQQALIQQSTATQNLLAPYLYQSMGLTPSYGPKGNITGFTQNPQIAGLQSQQYTLQSELLDREQAALKGQIPVDPGLITQLDQSEAQLHNELRSNLGPGYETSTSGSTALNQWQTYRSNILEAARRGDLTMAEQLSLGMQGGAQSQSQFLTQGSSGIAAMPAQYGGMFGQAAQGYNAPLQLMQNDRQLQMQASMFNAQQSAGALGALGGGLGQLAGIGLYQGLQPGAGGSGFLLSTKEAKEELGDISVLEDLKSLPIKRWRYKREVGLDRSEHIGPYAEDFKDRFKVGDGRTIALVDYLGVQLAALKEIGRELELLKDSHFLEA